MGKIKKILLCEARGPIVDLIEKLSGENADEWLTRLKKCLRQEGDYPIWGKLKTSIYSDDTMLLHELDKSKVVVGIKNSDINLILDTRTAIQKVCSENKVAGTYNLIGITPSDIGFTNLRPTLMEFYTKAFDMGLDLCPATIGPELRLEYEESTYLNIAMKPIVMDDGCSFLFILGGQTYKRLISVIPYEKDKKVNLHHKWLFINKK